MMSNIPESFYSEIHAVMPIICVDIVVVNGSEVLLICRDRAPEKGTWWFPGGRLLKGESLKQAACRLVKKETNLLVSGLSYLGIAETKFLDDPFGHNCATHTVNAVYLGRVKETDVFSQLILDDDHVGYKWVSVQDIYKNDYHSYIKRHVAIAHGAIDC